MTIRLLEKTDIAVIVDGFKESGWQIKPTSVFEQYLYEQEQAKRICLVAFVNEKFAGYVTLKWQSDYKNFADDNIPEISDLNVLPSFRKKGIGCWFFSFDYCKSFTCCKYNRYFFNFSM